ncbi:serine/threonine-protein phosphatase with EF-hands 2 isoform X2 [Hippocampus zosterae]|uniref:serine/threonine-protein phosphatase with EF-hands 2 isoform X2 n=1 Tax=Hippocampus zosterae TaxID=109293 RepID=UPI00223D756F|nr:serine/threonine-protein phosphatase with EF-hands 2 isoform X2 [Hippocampus zosterae]
MGCGVTKSNQFQRHAVKAIRAAVLIQQWYRQYVARMEMRRRYTWHIFQSIEYSGEQAQIKLYNFLGYLMDNFTPASDERNLISHIFRENEVCHDAEWERYFCYKNIEVPEIYSGPRLRFPLTAEQAVCLLEAFRNKKQLHSRYVLQLLLETWKLLRMLPNISRISTCHSKEITVCGDLHGQLEDLLLIFYKNGTPSLEKPYVFNGDFVDRGKDSMEILLILFAFLLVYPTEVHLNRGNHEDHLINLRYGFTKEVLSKYKMHGKRILKLLQKIFSWLPLAAVIDQKVLVLHGGISDSTDLGVLAKADRRAYVSALRPPKKKRRQRSSAGTSVDSDADDDWANRRLLRRRASLVFPKPAVSRDGFLNRSLRDFSDRIELGAEDEAERLGSFGAEREARASLDSLGSDGAKEEWKQILDLLWSDPMSQDGCIPNELRGGGCYWGPDVTRDFLSKHNMQLIVRSHECKQDGYEFCHDRKVLTLFSASNYYDVGSNRGAYVKLGPDLVPYVVQYQASSMTRELTAQQSVGQTERSALKVLREQLFSHKSDLIWAFKAFDSHNTGLISVTDWATAVEGVMRLGLPWRMLRSQLVGGKSGDGLIDYRQWFDQLAIKGANADHIDQSLLETLYRHRSTLETIFRIVDTNNSGFISPSDFRQTWKLLSVYLKMEITDEAISELTVAIDSNRDGAIDIDEFMEAFRLTDKKSRLERGRSMFMATAPDLSALDPDEHV